MTIREPLVFLLLLLLGCERMPREGDPAAPGTSAAAWFVEVARDVGLDFVHSSGAANDFFLPEIIGSGCAWIDYDQDGDLDAYLVSSRPDRAGKKNRLYRQESAQRFVDVTAGAAADHAGFGMGCAVGDYDGDGFPDLYLTHFGPNALLRNNRDGTFADVTEKTNVGDPRWSASACFVDVDADGDLDLFVANYMKHPPSGRSPCADEAGRPEYCGPNSHYPPERNTLFRNHGGAFDDTTAAAGMAAVTANSLGVTSGDFNRDGHVDLYVATDETPNQLWLGDGKGHFIDKAVELGAAFNHRGQSQAGMGVHAEDVDGDGMVDLFVTNLSNETNAFYLGSPSGFFEDVISRTGLAVPSLPNTGFGTGFFDADHDGDLDLLVVNGRVRRGSKMSGVLPPPPWDLYAEAAQFFEHVALVDSSRSISGGGPWGVRFEDRSLLMSKALQAPQVGRGLAFGDYDGDGDVDALITACNGPVRLLRNDAPKRGRWLSVRAVLKTGTEAHGAQITVRARERAWSRRVEPAYSYLSSSDPRVHFGLGDIEAADLEVIWPDRQKTQVTGLQLDSYLVVKQASSP